MYYQFFGLKKNAFSMTPDPSSLYLTAAHREAIAGLTYGAFSRKGFVVLTGEAGTGKTTLLRRLVELSKESSARCSVVFNPLLSPAEFLELLLYNFGLRDMPPSKTQRLLKLEELLLETHRTRKTAVLIVDEAHKLSHDVFEEIRLLTNFETGDDKLLQIVLAGQPELKTVLSHPDLWQLKQRIAVRLQIDPLAARQVGAFIAYRWARFGGAEPQPFSGEAIALIAQWSRGIPRLVNSICDNALLLAFSQQVRRVDADAVLEVVRDLDLPAPLEELAIEDPGTEEAEASEGKAHYTPPPAAAVVKPHVNGNGHGTGNGHSNGVTNGHNTGPNNGVNNGLNNGLNNGHAPTPPVNHQAPPAEGQPGQPLKEPVPAFTAKTDLLLDSERVRAHAATRPRPSVFQRSEPSRKPAASDAGVPPPAAASAAASAAAQTVHALREPVRVKRLVRHDPEPVKGSPMMAWLSKLKLVRSQPNSVPVRKSQIGQFLTNWRKK